MLKSWLKTGTPIAILFFLLGNAFAGDQHAPDPLSLYHQGLSATIAEERDQAIEKALELYMIEYNQMKAGGKTNAFLCYNIGNCYFNLKQTGLAVYYYKMAVKLLPGNSIIAENLKTALEKRSGAIDVKEGGLMEDLLFFHYKTSTRTRIDTLILLSVLTLLFYGITMLKQRTLFRYLALTIFSLCLCVGISLLAEYYSPRYEGVVITPSFVRKDKGDAFSPVMTDPLGEGSIVRILSLNEEWLKVEAGEGKKGYIRKELLKVVI
jgi:tetratricopeptide (TPR) repeat protein